MSEKSVFLDRDGVINEKAPEGKYVKYWHEFHFLSGVKKAIQLLNESNFLIFIITNQRGIAKGLMNESDLKDIHSRMSEELMKVGGIDGIYYCPHEKGTCNCRKPDIGLFRQAKVDFPEIEFRSSYLVGDSESDIIAGNKIGAQTILIRKCSSSNIDLKKRSNLSKPDRLAESLLIAAKEHIIGNLE